MRSPQPEHLAIGRRSTTIGPASRRYIGNVNGISRSAPQFGQQSFGLSGIRLGIACDFPCREVCPPTLIMMRRRLGSRPCGGVPIERGTGELSNEPRATTLPARPAQHCAATRSAGGHHTEGVPIATPSESLRGASWLRNAVHKFTPWRRTSTPWLTVRRCDSRRVSRDLAERVGFEPTVAINHTAFRERHLQPLGHLSGSDEYRMGRGRRPRATIGSCGCIVRAGWSIRSRFVC